MTSLDAHACLWRGDFWSGASINDISAAHLERSRWSRGTLKICALPITENYPWPVLVSC